MSSVHFSSATTAPPIIPPSLQTARIAARVNVSASVAQVMAALAFGAERRDHDVMLAGLVVERVGATLSRGC